MRKKSIKQQSIISKSKSMVSNYDQCGNKFNKFILEFLIRSKYWKNFGNVRFRIQSKFYSKSKCC